MTGRNEKKMGELYALMAGINCVCFGQLHRSQEDLSCHSRAEEISTNQSDPSGGMGTGKGRKGNKCPETTTVWLEAGAGQPS